jgi:predicted amidohydrolase YtcJ
VGVAFGYVKYFKGRRISEMKKQTFVRVLFFVCVLYASVCSCNQDKSTPADSVLINARIYTVNPEVPWTEAMAVRDRKIIAVGSDESIAAYKGPSTKVIDAKGNMVLPGFVESHVHMMAGAGMLERISLNEAKTIADFQKMIKDYAIAHPEKEWIQGMGWYYSIFGKSGLPNKKYIDEVVSDRPVYLAAFDGHSSLANSKALELAGITKDTPDPPAGVIARDPETGEPTGVFKEGASQLIYRAIPPTPPGGELDRMTKAIHYASSLGITRLISAGGDAVNVELFDEIREKGELTTRLYMARFINPPLTPDFIKNLEEKRKKYNDDWIDLNTVKFLMDGVIESNTAAMLEPYTNDPTNSGFFMIDSKLYKESVAEFDRLGFTISTHAIGDATVRLALDAYEAAAKANGRVDARHRIEHIEAPSAQDIPRFGKLGVIASMQPLHAIPNDNNLNNWAANIGPERASRAWPWRSILTGGANLAFGSDWPVVTLNPWPALEILLTRKTSEGTPAGGWLPEQRLTLEEAIKGYTMGGAYAAKREKTEGSIEEGKLADVIIISQDLFKISPNQISETKVLMTMVGGKIVYQDPSWEGK